MFKLLNSALCNNEAGTSLIELTIYMALVTLLFTFGTPQLIAAKDRIEKQVAEIQSLQENNPYVYIP